MKDQINKANKILIATSTKADYDALCAAISLGKVLKAQQKDISLLIPRNEYSRKVIELFPTQNLKLIEKNDPESFIVSLDKKDAQVKDVKWKEDEGKIQIYITTEKGTIQEGRIAVKPNYAIFDLAITIGINSLDDLGEFYKKNQKAFPKSRIIQIGNIKEDIGGFKLENESSIYSQLAVEFLEKLEIDINSETATDFLAGILWRTQGLYNLVNKKTIQIINKLSENQANLQEAGEKGFKNRTLSDIRLIESIIRKLVIHKDKTAYAILKKEDLKGIDIKKIISLDWIIVDRLKGVEKAFILIEAVSSVFGLLISTNPNINALKLTKQYNTNGNSYCAKFETRMDSIQKVEKVLKEEILTGKQEQDTKSKKRKEDRLFTNQNKNTQDAITTTDPLAPATSPLEPLDISTEEPTEEAKGGFTPPPPISPLQPAQ